MNVLLHINFNICFGCLIETVLLSTNNIIGPRRENLSLGFCEQHRHRPSCASAQSDQRLCYSRFGKYYI